MPSPGAFIFGPSRAVSVLGLTEILSWGALFYPPVLTVPLIAADHGWSPPFAMAGFSVGLSVGGLLRWFGRLVSRATLPPGLRSALPWRHRSMIRLLRRSAESSAARRARRSPCSRSPVASPRP